MHENNIITAIVDENSNKKQIKEILEKQWNVKIEKVNILNTKNGKKAYIKINKDYKAIDIANKYGII